MTAVQLRAPRVSRGSGARVQTRALSRALRLPEATTPHVDVRRDIPVPMPDGVTLLADLYRPRGAGPSPTVVVRTPYGRTGMMALLSARLLAERGLQVLLQSCRGTFGSGGTLDPFRERDDGLATLDWVRDQPWHSGRLATAGASYLGITQWALAAGAGPDLAAVVAAVTSSDPRAETYPGDGLALELALSWAQIASVQELRFGSLRPLLRRHRFLRALDSWPLARGDRLLLGKTVPFYQEWLARSAPGDPYWTPRVFSDEVANVEAAVDLVGGWYDSFLPGQVRDFRRLRDAGRRVHLTVGPWTHVSPGLVAEATRRAIAVLRSHLVPGTGMPDEAPVRVFVTGAAEWRDSPDWPPPGVEEQRWHLHAGRALAPTTPSPSEPDAYRYDPANPTPALGGPVVFGRPRRDNAPLERRSDVVTYTSAPLTRPVEMLGSVRADVYLGSNRPHTDLFVRLCEVDARGVSTHVCDGLRRLTAGAPAATADGTRRVEVELSPIAHRFARGHRLRAQISSGAHPRFARNPGTGASLDSTDAELLTADQRIFHDPQRPSALVLPILRHGL
jgi:putative CocE/NonD family hydrolase